MIREAIILAGGLGTRLRETISDVPKSMAPVAGHPFITHIIRHLLSQGVQRFIFSIGYKHDVIEKFLAEQFYYLNYKCVIESTPLGTGGAIRLALDHADDRDVMIVNGDTLFKISADDLFDIHMESQADCTIALKPMKNFDRYGSVEVNEDGRIIDFKEKQFVASGLINGGVYLLNRVSFQKGNLPTIFSMERDYLEKSSERFFFQGIIQDKYFIDIGIRQDFERAQHELKYPEIPLNQIDNTWTLFLDRDGVINKNKDESYVFHKGEFEFLSGTIEAIKKLSDAFGKIIIVTNQRGIGKGLMTESALNEIHDHMLTEIRSAGGRIDALYYCAINDDKHHDRKPNPGMLLEAAHRYPEIDFCKSIMVGDKITDVQLGRNVGAYTVLISSEEEIVHDADLIFPSLFDFSDLILKTSKKINP